MPERTIKTVDHHTWLWENARDHVFLTIDALQDYGAFTEEEATAFSDRFSELTNEYVSKLRKAPIDDD